MADPSAVAPACPVCAQRAPPLVRVVLPWPPSALSPNARVDRRAVSGLRKSYRHDCGWLARKFGARNLAGRRLSVHLLFRPPDRRRRDWDNLIATMKAGLDGLADALGVDDAEFRLSMDMAAPVKHGAVDVTITEVPS
jgi:crossover junction endodeoxyribonuclease RusA